MSSALRSGTCNALIVDDDPSLRQSLARALAQCRFRCDFADNGRQALRMIAGSRYDLVVTNLRMPEVNGHALAVELLGQADRPVVIIVSEVLEPKIERDLRAAGVDDILFKPIDFSMLAERAEELIELRAAHLDVCGVDCNAVSLGVFRHRGDRRRKDARRGLGGEQPRACRPNLERI